MEFLNIKEYVKREKLKMAAERNRLSKDLLNREFLAIVQVGNNPASDAYIKGKRKDAAEINLQTRLYNSASRKPRCFSIGDECRK